MYNYIFSGNFGISDSSGIIAKSIDIIELLLGKFDENPNSGTTEITNFSDSFGIFCNLALHKPVGQASPDKITFPLPTGTTCE